MSLNFVGEVWQWKSPSSVSGWFFVSVPQKFNDTILAHRETGEKKRGRGSVRVEVTVAFLSWKTSIFPDKKSGHFILPLKKKIRENLQVSGGDKVGVELKLLVE